MDSCHSIIFLWVCIHATLLPSYKSLSSAMPKGSRLPICVSTIKISQSLGTIRFLNIFQPVIGLGLVNSRRTVRQLRLVSLSLQALVVPHFLTFPPFLNSYFMFTPMLICSSSFGDQSGSSIRITSSISPSTSQKLDPPCNLNIQIEMYSTTSHVVSFLSSLLL